MRERINRIYANPKFTSLFKWGKLITITGGGQAIVQGTGLVSGIIVIHLLPTQQYAWYTIANTMLGTMSLLADGGISTGVLAQGGQVWQDREKLGAVFSTGLDLRKRLSAVSLVVSIPVLIYLLMSHQANWLTTLLITLSLIPAFLAALSGSLLEIVPKLHQDIASLQKNQITVSIGRLLLSSFTLFIFPFSFVAILASGLPRIYGNKELRRIANVFANTHQKPQIGIRKDILNTVRRILPGSIYYCLSSQITIWIISIFGNTTSIANIGALGRLSMLLGVISMMFSTLIIPRFARMTDTQILLKRYFQILLIMLFILLIINLIVQIFPDQLLWILGKKYQHLNIELTLIIIGTSLNLLMGAALNLYSSRGWVINPFLAIVLSILPIIIGTLYFDLSTVIGVLNLNIFVGISEFLIHFIFGCYKIKTLERSR